MNISVVIPVYNVEDYLHYAIDSLVNQTHKNFEVLLINDGSTDNSGKLCDKYAQEYDWIRVFHKENGGLSDARNYGVLKATNEWIFFLDPDDYIEPFTFELLTLIRAKYQADLISTKVQTTNEYEKYFAEQFNLESSQRVTKEEALELMLEDKVATVSACAKLYKKQILEMRPFPVGKIYEDFFVVAEHLRLAEQIVISPVVTYHYYRRPGSIVQSQFTDKRFDFFEAGEYNRNQIKQFYSGNSVEKALNLKIVQGSFHISEAAASTDTKALRNIVKKVRSFYWSIIFDSKASVKFKVKYSWFLLTPNLYCRIKKMLKRSI
ncbi:glycosyltransferase family 2 protein [Streptococcus mitis]|jgi:putative glycosyltransferase|uniref:glycosyltransferase family 2 protein n=1 Tax=Streptococcus mitis TaxID=28037 RepID=UPI001CBF54F6|nr:glycosyltransferase family 2 protein [Streptococcus mitis]MBZ2107302.1 glycosyltransferase [Streptococcus mitis]MBZ2113660.1 glycosyltransferase [Streptococcus mitis]